MECSVMSALTKFTAPELLANNNKIICSNCTKLQNKCKFIYIIYEHDVSVN